MTTEAAVKSRDSERQPTATPAIISGVQDKCKVYSVFILIQEQCRDSRQGCTACTGNLQHNATILHSLKYALTHGFHPSGICEISHDHEKNT